MPSMAVRLRIELILSPLPKRLRKLLLMTLHLLAVVFGVAGVDMVVCRELLLAELLDRRFVEIEVAVSVAAAHQHRRHAFRSGRARMRRDVVDAESDPALRRVVGCRAVHAERMVQ